jgi:chemotaxis regulatin CheY-phosphate phosphatase CheZ
LTRIFKFIAIRQDIQDEIGYVINKIKNLVNLVKKTKVSVFICGQMFFIGSILFSSDYLAYSRINLKNTPQQKSNRSDNPVT